ncbi:MAG TPA: tripartite tricarboxylate transporter TctB family protein [Candidatus Limnocylindrales bacterium]|nr:tripartite tricarboxylate transporter TctB family protein [Candidatus Limnocylindrales bacterium]
MTARRDAVVGLVLTVAGLAVLRASIELPAGTPGDPLGPRGFPLLLGAGMAACGLVLLAAPLAARWRRPAPALAEVVVDDEERAPLSWPRAAATVAATAAYLAALVPLGALFATVLYALALLLIQGGVGWRGIAATAVAFPLLLILLFGVALGIPLPAGPLEPLFLRLGL